MFEQDNLRLIRLMMAGSHGSHLFGVQIGFANGVWSYT
jgi:hypothetical protein